MHLPITMGYDRAPEQLIDEKRELLEYAIQHDARVFYTHDPVIAMSSVTKDSKGKFQAGTIWRDEVEMLS